jgi:hypothetical protein
MRKYDLFEAFYYGLVWVCCLRPFNVLSFCFVKIVVASSWVIFDKLLKVR